MDAITNGGTASRKQTVSYYYHREYAKVKEFEQPLDVLWLQRKLETIIMGLSILWRSASFYQAACC